MRRCSIFLCLNLTIVASTHGLQAQTIEQAISLPADAHIKAVTLYRGRAAITRTATLTLNPGVYDLQFTNLPEAVQPQTLQARAGTNANIKVLGVDFLQEAAAAATSPQIAQLDAAIEDLQKKIKQSDQQAALFKAQEDFINAVTVRAASDATKDGGTDKLDIESIRKQLAFVTEERTKLAAARAQLEEQRKELDKQLQVAQQKRNAAASGANAARTAIVSLVATEAGPATIDLVYLVSNATWEPSYNIRAATASGAATIEYDAILTQRTGEDWDNVELTLSTAQPAVAADPPVLQPWYLDIHRPEVERAAAAHAESGRPARDMAAPGAPPPPAPSMRAADPDERNEAILREMAGNAEVAGDGPSITFQLPRAITVKTNAQKQQKTRVANIDTKPQFIHVATPSLTDAVYIRGELTNASAFQLLPGRASIFIGGDFVGPTTMTSVAAGGEFKLYFGIDPAVKASRQLVKKNSENTGLLSGGRRTSYDYRLSIDNGANKNITVELWDRYPVSRTADIQVELVDLSAPLATDAKYVAEEKPQGMLKWMLNVPAGATGNAIFNITYGVRVNRAKDVQMTPLPE